MSDDLRSATTAAFNAPAHKALGGRALFATSIGVIVAQLGMVALLQGMGIGGMGFVLALFAAFAIAMANAMAYAEMALMMPKAASLSSYAEAAIGNFPAILLVFAGYVTPAIFGLPAELVLVEQILADTLGIELPRGTCAVALVTLFTVLNILGTDVFAKVQTALSFTVLIFLAVTGLVALSGHAGPAGGAAHAIAALSDHTVTLSLAALAFWVFVGSEFVTPLVPEARNANRDLPRAMLGGLAAIFIAQMLFALGGGMLLPRQELAGSGTPHLELAVAIYGPSARVWFAALALVASASLLNTVIAAVPRMLSGMADNGQAFPIFKRIHPRWGTPVYAIVFVGALPLIGLVWSGASIKNFLPLTVAASVSWLLAYVTAQISLVVLRRRYPHAPRPFKVPGYPWVPVLAMLAMLYVVLHSSPDPAMTPRIISYTGIVLGLFALVAGLWVKFAMKKRLFEPTTPAHLRGAP